MKSRRAVEQPNRSKRIAFSMQVHSDKHEEYRQRHNPVWEELVHILKEHGVVSYSIFLNSASSELFAYVEVLDMDHWNQIAKTAICREWWSYMSDVMPSNEDGSPQTTELTEVFHLG